MELHGHRIVRSHASSYAEAVASSSSASVLERANSDPTDQAATVAESRLAIGIVNQNVLPWPGVLVTPM